MELPYATLLMFLLLNFEAILTNTQVRMREEVPEPTLGHDNKFLRYK